MWVALGMENVNITPSVIMAFMKIDAMKAVLYLRA
jgi:hypothetical protein